MLHHYLSPYLTFGSVNLHCAAPAQAYLIVSGGSFRPIILETLILRYGLKGKARTRPDFIRVVLDTGAQFYPCEA